MSLPVPSDEFGEKFPETVVLANEQANDPSYVFVPACQGRSKRHGWPHAPWSNLSHNILSSLCFTLWHRIEGLFKMKSYK